ncbi:hypothetical protein HY991_04565 [Candidatus Micrarchaeota archaeon]|nr:hypothetical protein [Candidatus Micrarchaeota archaeon]
MVMNMKKTHFVFIGFLLVVSVLLFGCLNSGNPSDGDNGNPLGPAGRDGSFGNRSFGGRGFGNGSFGNLTEEQRQQFINDRLQTAVNACQNKAEGDSCVLSSPRGNLTGTCKEQNYALVCAAAFNGRQNQSRSN